MERKYCIVGAGQFGREVLCCLMDILTILCLPSDLCENFVEPERLLDIQQGKISQAVGIIKFDDSYDLFLDGIQSSSSNLEDEGKLFFR
ncbi:MAG: hypothetical protein HRT72_12485, partial [Flavobacteriales bacterium]|nr:hypothetical protein [Flavobacteriales bacterium]